ncbi:MAG: hypothetical protein WCS31_14580 [Verrucomicrobiae bacterium]
MEKRSKKTLVDKFAERRKKDEPVPAGKPQDSEALLVSIVSLLQKLVQKTQDSEVPPKEHAQDSEATPKEKPQEAESPSTEDPHLLENRPMGKRPFPIVARAEDTEAQTDIATEGQPGVFGRILQEFVPGLQNWLHDRRNRRDTIRVLQRIRHAGGHPGAEALPARALPKLASPRARKRRIAAWRVFRPVLRWQRRSPKAVFATYFGVLGALSLFVTACFLIPSLEKKPAAPTAPAAPAVVSMKLGVPAVKALQPPARTAPANARGRQALAEKYFQDGNYAAAEQQFREILPTTEFRALTGFQIFLCMLKQGKTAEAEFLAGRFPTGTLAKNPSGLYARAAKALVQGRTEDARADIESARRQYPLISPLYDKALAAAGLAPTD